jgi:hypothetical protein
VKSAADRTGQPQHGSRPRAEPVLGALPLRGVRHLHARVQIVGGGDADLGRIQALLRLHVP